MSDGGCPITPQSEDSAKRRRRGFFSFSDELLRQTWQAVSGVGTVVVKWMDSNPPARCLLPPPPPAAADPSGLAARQFRPKRTLRKVEDVVESVRLKSRSTAVNAFADESEDDPNAFLESLEELQPIVAQQSRGRGLFPWENLVFEGGGNKGMAYVGSLRVSAG